jgi:hypothetical protein
MLRGSAEPPPDIRTRAFPALPSPDQHRNDSGLRTDAHSTQVALDAVRIHGGYGYSTEYDVERYFRDAPLMIVGEGTNEIQRNVIAAQLVKRGGLDRW